MVCMLDSRLSGPDRSPGQEQVFGFLDKTLSVFSPPRCINGYQQINLMLEVSHPGGVKD